MDVFANDRVRETCGEGLEWYSFMSTVVMTVMSTVMSNVKVRCDSEM